MKKLIPITAIVVLMSCSNSSDNVLNPSEVSLLDSLAVERISQSLSTEYVAPIYRYQLPDGHIRGFFEVVRDYHELHTTIIDNESSPIVRIHTPYDRYDDGDDFYYHGAPRPFKYINSPDKRYLYIVEQILASSNGWVTEYQMYKIDCVSLNVKLLADCAAIKVTENGFVKAECRMTYGGPSVSTCNEIWMIHDEYLDWEGNTVKIDESEYDHDEMIRRYPPVNEYCYVSGFKQSKIE